MKNGVSKLRIYRTSTSPYFPTDFNQREKKALENLGAEMVSGFPCDVLITNTHTDLSKIKDSDLAELKLIMHPNSGYDNYNAEFINKLKIPVIVGSSIRAQAVAQYILSTLFARIIPVNNQTSWSSGREFNRPLLGDLNVLIIGHGQIGQILEASLKPLVKTHTIHDPFKNMHNDVVGSDVLILACGYNFSNHHMVNENFLKKLSPNVLIINAARGELIDTQSLITFLKNNPKASAVLDVFEKEPNDFNDFKDLKNILTTSHIAGVFNGIDQATIDFETTVLNDFLNNPKFESKYHAENLKNRLHEEGLL
jgi:lactate dehydrogenase-like 2-hydroxyacid dehydrogenase